MQNNITQSSLLESYINQNNGGLNNAAPYSSAPLLYNNQAALPVPQLNGQPEADILQKTADQKDDKERSKKGTIAKVALLSAVALSAGVGIAAAFRHKGGAIKSLKEIPQQISGFFKGKGEKAGKTLEKAKDAAGDVANYQKGADNITNGKDTICRHFLFKIPGYEKFDTFVSNIYRKASVNTMSKQYAKAKDALDTADDAVLEAIKKSDLDEKGASRLRELISKRSESVKSFGSKNSIQQRFNKLDDSMDRLDIEAWDTLSGIREKEGGLLKSIKKFSKQSLAEGRLTKSKELQNQMTSAYKNMGLTEAEASELKELTAHVTKGGDGALSGVLGKADKLFKKAYTKENVSCFEKLRDINYGCAPTDVLSALGTVGLLGLYTAQADTKEERVGVTLTTGIPLVVTLGTTIGMTVKMVGGIKALAVGSVTGLFANIIGSKVNKKYQEAHGIKEPVKTIVTLDDYVKTVDGIRQKII